MSIWSRIDRSDLWVGGAAVMVGTAVIPYALSMPEFRNTPGPGLFPLMIAGLGILFGVSLVSKACWRARSGAPAPQAGEDTAAGAAAAAPQELRAAEGDDSGPTMRPSLAATERARWVNAATALGSIVFYILLVETLGFLLTMFAVLSGIMLVLRSRWWVALATAAVVTLALHTLFQRLLLVQLPGGILAW